MQSLPLEKASNKQFQREREVTQQVTRSCVEVKCRHENRCILMNYWLTQIYYNLIVIFICNVFFVWRI